MLPSSNVHLKTRSSAVKNGNGLVYAMKAYGMNEFYLTAFVPILNGKADMIEAEAVTS